MHRVQKILSFVTVLLLNNAVQAQEPVRVFQSALAPPAAQTTPFVAALDAEVLDYVTIDLETLEEAAAIGRLITLNLPDGEEITVDPHLDRQEPNVYVVRGDIRGYTEPSRTLFTVANGILAGRITMGRQAVLIRYAGAGRYVVYEYEPDSEDNCTVDALGSNGGSGLALPPMNESQFDGGASVVDILILYTENAYNETGSGIEAEILNQIEIMNEALEEGGVSHEVNVVHIEEVDYEESGDLSDDIEYLTDPEDGVLDYAHTLREQFRADLVALVQAPEDENSCGIGWIGFMGTPADVYAFSVTESDCFGQFTLIHEIGHNLGLRHDFIEDDIEDGELFPHGRGWFSVPGDFTTFMAYDDYCESQGGDCDRIPEFSDPDREFNGHPLGHEDLGDAVRALEETMPMIASFRDPVTTDGPDLVAINATLSASTANPGDEVIATVDVLNDGDEVAPSSEFHYYWSTDPTLDSGDTLIEDESTSELDPQEVDDEEHTFSVPDVPLGDYYVLFVADADDEVEESDEDNVEAVSITVNDEGGEDDRPNLIVLSIDAPPSAEAGEEMEFDFVVAEVNDAPNFEETVRTVPFDMEYYLLVGNNEILVGSRTNPTDVLWPADREREFSGQADIPAGLAPGTYEMVVKVDTDDEVDETHENDNSGSVSIEVTMPTDTQPTSSGLPDVFALHAPYPNPVRGIVEMRYDLPERADVHFTVYDVLGRKVAVVADGAEEVGYRHVSLDTSTFPSGVYVIRLVAGSFAATHRLTVVR